MDADRYPREPGRDAAIYIDGRDSFHREATIAPASLDRWLTSWSSGAPLPRALAGALIGRIDNGLPFGIGDLTSITAPASGLLYLGTNDDNVSDNTGQFQVVISLGR